MRRRTLLSAGLLWGLTFRAHADSPADWDVIVVGSGTAGLCAGIAAREAGARRVLIVEKLPMVGGHGIVSSGSVALAMRRPETDNPRRDLDAMMDEMRHVGGDAADPELIRTLVEDSESAVKWLETLGVRWNRHFFRAVSSLTPRNISTGSAQAGYDYVQALVRRAKALGIVFRLNTRAVQIAEEKGRITGLYVQTMDTSEKTRALPETLPEGPTGEFVSTRALILATGGFSANPRMRQQWDPSIPEDLPTTANPRKVLLDGATGDGLVLAQRVGATLIGMPYIQVIPFSGGRLLDYVGGEIWIDDDGQRFIDEGMPFQQLRERLTQGQRRGFWAISDSQTRKGASLSTKLMEGTVKKAQTLEELANGIHIPVATLRATLNRWNHSVAQGYDEQFQHPLNGTSIEVPPFFYGRETWSVHFTCGGLRINREAAVLRADGAPIPGLFAAGEVTGGIHGKDRLGGNAMTDTFVFGRRAGRFAAQYAQKAF